MARPLPRFSAQWLDELRARIALSELLGRDIALTRAGREHKACCPFHDEKTPSFTVNDDKGFYHCFGCGAHGDAIRWLTDHRGLGFVEAVEALAAEAGMDVPAPSAEAAKAAALIAGQRPTLEAASAIYADHLARDEARRNWLAERGVGEAAVAEFGLGFAPEHGALRGQGFNRGDLVAVGLVGASEPQGGGVPFYYPRFRSRIMIPIHDARGRIVGFGGRSVPGAKGGAAKYVNSPASAIFDKGRLLFNLHRARERFRDTRRLVIVEGYFDAIQAHGAGFAVVAPMGTALTADQMERAWRIDPCPLLLFDGDEAGMKAALRACEAALPLIGPGRSMTVALLPQGMDPDDVVRAAAGEDAAMALTVAVLAGLRRLDQLLYDASAADYQALSGAARGPEAVAAVWHRLDEWARAIADDDIRTAFLAAWRARYEREFLAAELSGLPVPVSYAHPQAHLTGVWDEEHRYFWPDPVDDGERHLIRILREKLAIRAERKALTERNRDIDALAKLLGLDPAMINKTVADIEADPDVREGKEARWALYRRVAGVKGPMNEAMMPSLTDGRGARPPSAAAKRMAAVNAMIAGGV